jgi:hypothetical protein
MAGKAGLAARLGDAADASNAAARPKIWRRDIFAVIVFLRVADLTANIIRVRAISRDLLPVPSPMTDTSPLLRILPCAGALPFVGCAVLQLIGIRELPLFGDVKTVASTYGLAIISFMAGVHWGQYLEGKRVDLNLLVASNAVTLAAWFGFLLLPQFAFSLVLVVLFGVAYLIDRQLHLPSDYLTMRRNVTLIVSASLLLGAWL